MRSKEEYERVIELGKEGLNPTEIFRATGIPRGTISDWISGKHYMRGKRKPKIKVLEDYISFLTNGNQLTKDAYSYVLGLYLGDGYIHKSSRSFRMKITLDKKYQSLNDYAKEQLQIVFKQNSIGETREKNSNSINITVYNSGLPFIFPQHGKGMKHSRKIELKKWQKDILNETMFLKGLAHSDGCFYKSKQGKYTYSYFAFVNTSKDINNLFQEYLNRNGIGYTFHIRKKAKEHHKDVGITKVYQRKNYNRLVETIGTKTNIKR